MNSNLWCYLLGISCQTAAFLSGHNMMTAILLGDCRKKMRKKPMQFHRQFAGALALLGVSMGSVAGNFDGSAPFLCAVTDAISCEMAADCVEGPAAAVNFPVFIRIDAEKKVVQSHRQSGEDRVSQILSVHQEGSAVVFLGVDQGQGWSLAVNQTTGQMTASTSADGMGYVVFGACTPL